MTNFLKMACAISDLGYDVYIFKAGCKKILFVDRQTERIYICYYSHYLDYSEYEGCFSFEGVSTKGKNNEPYFDGYTHGCLVHKDGKLRLGSSKNLMLFLDDILSDMEKIYTRKNDLYPLYNAESLIERDIAELGYRLGFRYKYQIHPAVFSCKSLVLGGAGYGYKISAAEYYAEMKKQNPNLKIVVAHPQEEWEQLKKMGDSSFFFLK